MSRLKITRQNWQGMVKFSINRLRADSALLQAALQVYTAWIIGNWSLEGGYTILGLYLSKKLFLACIPLVLFAYFYFDLTRVWISEQEFNAKNHPFWPELLHHRAELAEIKTMLEELKSKDRPIRAFWGDGVC